MQTYNAIKQDQNLNLLWYGGLWLKNDGIVDEKEVTFWNSVEKNPLYVEIKIAA